jgi:hydroxymethylglutaryl-CoA lyase
LANALMAVEIGITHFDSSLGGIGGCPFAPGASGNIVTEDLVWLLESMGLRTGIDLEQLLAVREQLRQALPDVPLYGFLAEAGLPGASPPLLDPRNPP